MYINSERKIIDKIITVSKDQELQRLAHKYSQEVFGADDPIDALKTIQSIKPDIILYDYNYNPKYIRDLVTRSENISANTPLVVICCGNYNEKYLQEEFFEAGAYDFITGEKDYKRLNNIIAKIKKENVQETNNINRTDNGDKRFFINEIAESVCMVGKSNSVKKVLELIKIISQSQCNPILIVGETGTGKELVAKAIHNAKHPEKKFVAINCAALTANLLESELFGHVKGSFTGADREKTGLLELAESGTVFLDEISEMPMELQAKLLRVLEDKTFRKVGGIKTIECKATIIASSNRNLKHEVEENRFRNDLYYRLNVFPIVLSPIRSEERKEDIILLAEYFINTSAISPNKRNKVNSLTRLAAETIEKYDWPGNVRELRNVINRAILLETTDKIGLNGIIFDPEKLPNSIKENTVKRNDYSLERAERELISKALNETGWQKTRAATLLGITRATLYSKVKQYNIEKNTYIEDNLIGTNNICVSEK
jgi:DNA-binding NtrC family response regulator